MVFLANLFIFPFLFFFSGIGGVLGNKKAIYDDLMDRQSASKAVAIVVHTASKRGYVPLCTEFASLIRENKR